LLAPQATPIAMPAGMLFGALFGVRHRPAGARTRKLILALGLGGSLISGTMLAWTIPVANQTFRVMVYENSGHSPAKGLRELTWPELKERMAHAGPHEAGSQERQLRFTYQSRISLALAPIFFAFIGTVLVNAKDGRADAQVFGLALYVSYFTVIRLGHFVDAGTLSPIAAAWAPNLTVLLLPALLTFKHRVSLLFGHVA
jgi:lipopolysaccharide export LptBFGC system permease protein LptF